MEPAFGVSTSCGGGGPSSTSPGASTGVPAGILLPLGGTTAPLGLPSLSHSPINPCSSILANRSASNLLATAGSTRLSIRPVLPNWPVASSRNMSGADDAAHGGIGSDSGAEGKRSRGRPVDIERWRGLGLVAGRPGRAVLDEVDLERTMLVPDAAGSGRAELGEGCEVLDEGWPVVAVWVLAR